MKVGAVSGRHRGQGPAGTVVMDGGEDVRRKRSRILWVKSGSVKGSL